MQSGTSVVSEVEGKYRSTLLDGKPGERPNSVLALQFYTDFANPRKTVYSWNKNYERSREAFAANKVAMYAGFASEIPVLTKLNPNLNYDIALWPQSVQSTNKLTYGKFYGIAAVKKSRNVSYAYSFMFSLADPKITKTLSAQTRLPVVRRDALTVDPKDPFTDVLVRSAIIARGWRRPESGSRVDDLFSGMVNSVTSGQSTYEEALELVSADLNVMFERYDPKK
jgi:ABC-type glycerol-3-phosphate transport system substrate-binding protein